MGPSLLPKILPVALNGPAVSLRCSWYPCMSPLLLPKKNTTNGNEWAHCYSWDAAKALAWAYHCCQKNLLMVTKRPTASPVRCCWYPEMGPSLLPKVLLMILNGPAVFSEMLLVSLHEPIVADKNITNGNEWVHRSSQDVAEALVWACCCCQSACMGPSLLPKHLYGPIVAAERTCQWPRGGSLPLLRCWQYAGMSPLLLLKFNLEIHEWA